jgi:hypothetical protein
VGPPGARRKLKFAMVSIDFFDAGDDAIEVLCVY